MILFEDDLEEPSLDEVLPGVVVTHLNGLQLTAGEAGLAVVRKFDLVNLKDLKNIFFNEKYCFLTLLCRLF